MFKIKVICIIFLYCLTNSKLQSLSPKTQINSTINSYLSNLEKHNKNSDIKNTSLSPSKKRKKIALKIFSITIILTFIIFTIIAIVLISQNPSSYGLAFKGLGNAYADSLSLGGFASWEQTMKKNDVGSYIFLSLKIILTIGLLVTIILSHIFRKKGGNKLKKTASFLSYLKTPCLILQGTLSLIILFGFSSSPLVQSFAFLGMITRCIAYFILLCLYLLYKKIKKIRQKKKLRHSMQEDKQDDDENEDDYQISFNDNWQLLPRREEEETCLTYKIPVIIHSFILRSA